LFDGLGHCRLDGFAVADVADDRQSVPAGVLDLLGRGIDGALEFGVRLGGLGDQGDVGAVGGELLLAMARPMPRLAPEMNTVFPENDMSSSCRVSGDQVLRRYADRTARVSINR
jgi:hypothetical protein